MTSVAALLLLLSGIAWHPENAGCRISGSALTAADSVRAQSACVTARGRFAELFGTPVPMVEIVLWDRASYRTGMAGGRAVVLWPSTEAAAAPSGDTLLTESQQRERWGNMLPHEIAHALLAVRFYAEAEPAAGYGTPLPDWLDEAVAIWAESLDNRESRLEHVSTLHADRPALREILAARHPGAADPRVLAMRDGAPPPDADALVSFYREAIAVLQFVYDTGGPAAVRELVARLVRDPARVEAIAGLPGLPGDFDGVARRWADWAARGAPQGGG